MFAVLYIVSEVASVVWAPTVAWVVVWSMVMTGSPINVGSDVTMEQLGLGHSTGGCGFRWGVDRLFGSECRRF
jgi:hypothetical protein